jgi:hypothetical protein
VERFFAWLHHSRRLLVRWEYHVENFLGMMRLGCIKSCSDSIDATHYVSTRLRAPV